MSRDALPMMSPDAPLVTACRVADRLIRHTPLRYRLGLPARERTFDGARFVDFGRTFGTGRPAVAYAWTRLIATREGDFELEIEHNDGCRVWLDGTVVYERRGDRDFELRLDERSVSMSASFRLRLRKGPNVLLVKSETRGGGEWCVCLQPPSLKGSVAANGRELAEIGLHGLEQVDAKVAALSDWLVIGPFANRVMDGVRSGMDEPGRPEQGLVVGRMEHGIDGPVTWTIPRIEVLGQPVNPQAWGTFDGWNYHNGGSAWALQALSVATGDRKYARFAARFCDFHLTGMPFVRHQVRALKAITSANCHLIDTPLLDFTLAPSLPILNRLIVEADFPERPVYQEWIRRMVDYAKHGQTRLPGHGIYTRTTPDPYTTWADDMFMGIPFLVHASRWVEDPAERDELLDDAAAQALGFGTEVWDQESGLYMHAHGFASPVKLPHWSRCNGWAIWALSEVLLHLPRGHRLRGPILDHFREHAASLAALQLCNGFWRNVLDHPDSEEEVSGTAIFVMAMARGISNGWLDAATFVPVVERGWSAIESATEADGTVHRICMGTMCSEDVGYYLSRPLYDDDTHGLFAVLWAAMEVAAMRGNVARPGEPAAAPAAVAAVTG